MNEMIDGVGKVSMPAVRVNLKFARLIQPPGEVELEKILTVLKSSDIEPVVCIWRGEHLYDQHLYDLCRENDIPFKLVDLNFEDDNKAALHICSDQLSRENLTAEYRKYIIGKKLMFLINSMDESVKPDSKYMIASALAHELHLSAGTVLKYRFFADAMDKIFDQDMDFAQRMLLGKVRVSHENLVELSRLMPDELKAVAKATINDNVTHIARTFIRSEAKMSHVPTRAPQSRREQTEEKMAPQASIRQMPQYNPDAEVNSLCLTIDIWIGSLRKIHNSSEFAKISNKASLQLMKKLSFLEHTINSLQESLVERGTI